MFEGMREALQYVVGLGSAAEKTEVVEICGKTYANRSLTRYDKKEKAEPMTATTLTALVDYIGTCYSEMEQHKQMIIHVVSPTEVKLVSCLDADREREVLFKTNAVVSGFQFDRWYDQEGFMISLQSNFQTNEDLELVMKVAGNIEKKNDQSYSDNGTTQVATMQVGVASKADVIVPNPVTLVPFRTFQEVPQPSSKFVFRMGDKEVPAFKIVEAEGGIWKNEAIQNIKNYLESALGDMAEFITSNITIIG